MIQNRKMKAVWSMEAAQDLSVHNLAAEDELTQILCKELQEEIDREIIEDLRKYAAIQKKKKKYRSIDDLWEI